MISTHSLSLEISLKLPLILFDFVHWQLYFIDFLIRRSHISLPWLMSGLYNYWWLITSFKYSLGNKETHVFYVASSITISAFSKLLWKSTLLVRYRLNRFRPPHVNQFDFCALLFGGYTRFITLDKWSYMVIGNLTSGS